MYKYFEKIVEPTQIQWANYHTMIFKTENEYFKTNKCLYYRAIKNTTHQKIYICNESMVEKSRELLKIDNFVIVDPSNWFSENFNQILQQTLDCIKEPNNCLILTSAGMGSKVLLMEIHKKYPQISFIDIGSALDLICSNKRSRDFHSLNESQINNIRKNLLYVKID